MSALTVWNQRSFVASGALLSGLSLPLTGLLDHAAGGTSSEAAVGWSIAHITLGCLFAGFCFWHILLNRRALLRYLRAKGRVTAIRRRLARETIAAAVIVGAVFVVTVIHALAEG